MKENLKYPFENASLSKLVFLDKAWDIVCEILLDNINAIINSSKLLAVLLYSNGISIEIDLTNPMVYLGLSSCNVAKSVIRALVQQRLKFR